MWKIGLHAAVQGACDSSLKHGCFLGKTCDAYSGFTFSSITSHIPRSAAHIWTTLAGQNNVSYRSTDFMYTQDPELFAAMFSVGVDASLCRWTDIRMQVCQILGISITTVMYPFVLSKTSENMPWHVDGGVNAGTDVVIYFVFGPLDSVSRFRVCSPAVSSALSASETSALNRVLRSYDTMPFEGDLPDIPVASWRMDKVDGRAGDLIVFDGSSLHSVENVQVGELPQIALAINIRGALSQLRAKHKCPGVRLEMEYPRVKLKLSATGAADL